MALDHYISQVYLRKFLAPNLGNRMYAMRKSDLATFTPRPRDVCRLEDGSSNKYLKDERAIEDFLGEVEPRFNDAVAGFVDDIPSIEHIYTMAGLITYFLICSPAALRINSGPVRAQLEAVAKVLDEQGEIGPSPQSLGGASLTELLETGQVAIEVDGKYPSAIGIAGIYSRISLFGNSCWDILINENEGCDFFTSDYPVAVEVGRDPRVVHRIVPITPKVALRIIPDIRQSRAELDLSFTQFRYRTERITAAEARRLNQLFVKCAEDAVFAPDWQNWRPRFVEKHRQFRVDNVSQNIGPLIHNRIEIVPHNH